MTSQRIGVSVIAFVTLTFTLTLIWIGLTPGAAWAQAGNDAPPAVPAQEQPEVLTRGPVHEAFAQPVDLQAKPGLVAPIQPPANIQETPPDERPQGDNYVWIPGYWAWDADRKGYIWVSACWRAAPQGMYWVPGYWTQAPTGWQWVPGFWNHDGSQEIEYLPAPPDLGQTLPPNSVIAADQVWVPPCYYWVNSQYVLRPGYWLTPHEGWVWAPSHYVYTPYGYVFAGGHWDYDLPRRGVLFAPVYIRPAVYARVGFRFSPNVVVDVGVMTDNLFAYPAYSMYYFGDYYDNSYVSIGIYPWFECERFGWWYDPCFVYDRWRHRRNEPDWDRRLHRDYDLRRNDRNLRPARTYRDMEIRLAAMPQDRRGRYEIARPLSRTVARQGQSGSMRFQKIDAGTRDNIARSSTQVDRFRDDRSRWESAGSRGRASSQDSRSSQKSNQPSGQPGSRSNAPANQAPPASSRTQSQRVPISQPPIRARSRGSNDGGHRSPDRPRDEDNGSRRRR